MIRLPSSPWPLKDTYHYNLGSGGFGVGILLVMMTMMILPGPGKRWRLTVTLASLKSTGPIGPRTSIIKGCKQVAGWPLRNDRHNTPRCGQKHLQRLMRPVQRILAILHLGSSKDAEFTAISGNINGLKPSDFKGFSLKHSDISVYPEASTNLSLGASKPVLFAHCYAFCHHIHTGATTLSKYVAQPHILDAGWVCWSFAELRWSIAKTMCACAFELHFISY